MRGAVQERHERLYRVSGRTHVWSAHCKLTIALECKRNSAGASYCESVHYAAAKINLAYPGL